MTNAPDPSNWHLNPLTSVPLAHPANSDTTTPAAAKRAGGSALDTPAQLIEITAQHYPTVGICVVIVDGELDVLTAPLLEERVQEQLRATPTHLILDLEAVRFLGCSGLSCLLRTRELVQQTRGSQLHLASLTTRRVARALRISGLLGVFNTYPTLLHAVMAALTDHPEVTTSDNAAPTPVLAAVWCCSVGTTWTLELHELDHDMQLGPIVDWISSGVPVTQPMPDKLTHELLATRGLRLFRDPSPGSHTHHRHRIGYVCIDGELITLAYLIRGQAVKAELHHVMLAASWIAAGFSAETAAGWIRAGCLSPK